MRKLCFCGHRLSQQSILILCTSIVLAHAHTTEHDWVQIQFIERYRNHVSFRRTAVEAHVAARHKSRTPMACGGVGLKSSAATRPAYIYLSYVPGVGV